MYNVGISDHELNRQDLGGIKYLNEACIRLLDARPVKLGSRIFDVLMRQNPKYPLIPDLVFLEGIDIHSHIGYGLTFFAQKPKIDLLD